VPERPETPAAYHTGIRVRFGDCDAAGIVYYPRYLEMFNAVVEDWFRDELRSSFTEIVINRRLGLPTVHLEVDFVAPSHFDEKLSATLTVFSLGKSSLGLDIILRGPDNGDRVHGKVVIVLIERAMMRSIPWPSDLRERILVFQVKDDSSSI
jgi:4-hydroxybenzoyl-CoA thioesterase